MMTIRFALEVREDGGDWAPAVEENEAGELVPALYDSRGDAECDGRFYLECPGLIETRVVEVQS